MNQMNKLETKDAIKILLELHDQCCQADSIFCTDVTGARCEAVDMAITAMEKQIPKKPKMPLDAYWVCPTCGSKVEHPFEHCRRCGQAICWEQE